LSNRRVIHPCLKVIQPALGIALLAGELEGLADPALGLGGVAECVGLVGLDYISLTGPNGLD
jgi:hypothetical protein